MRVLLIATKSPFPPVGGGNVTLHALALGLTRLGVELRLLAPRRGPASLDGCPYPVRLVDDAIPRRAATLSAALVGESAAIARHRSLAFRAAALDELRSFAPDVVHLEQLHAAWLVDDLAPHAPVVLRQQNVESDLLRQWGTLQPAWKRWLYEVEARRLERFERVACESVDRVAAISGRDADALARLAPRGRYDVVPVAWPDASPVAPPATTASCSAPVESNPTAGDPTIVCLGSFDWAPNRHGATWFVERVWPLVRAARPAARLHLAGPGSVTLPLADRAGIVVHGRVADPRTLYVAGAVSAIPVTVGSGVRVRLLESWAADAPAVTTTLGGAGLVERDGDGALLADSPDAFAHALLAAADPERRAALAARGRVKLARHRGEEVARRMLESYRAAIAGRPSIHPLLDHARRARASRGVAAA